MKPELSHIEHSIARLEERRALESLYSPAPAWPAKEQSKARIAMRRLGIIRKFAEFDRLYFPPDVYDGQYAPTNHFHATIAAACEKSGRVCTLILGPHDHAKSATVYKKIVHAALTGERHFVGVVSETLDAPEQVIRAVSGFLQTNDRIRHDFPDLEILGDSAGELRLRTRDNARGCVIKSFSEWKSPRGKNVNLFQRFDLIIVEDLENRMSSMEADMVEKRRRKLAEYQSALADDGCLVMTANNFDENCVGNHLLREHEAGTLDASWRVFAFQAWGLNGQATAGPLWPERFPAKNEAALRAMLKPMDEETWAGSYQQQPRKPKGFYFESSRYEEYDSVPSDAVALTWCDPNLAEKSKGDTTAMCALLYSRATGKKYIFRPRCRSFRDSNDLLDAYFDIVSDLYAVRIPVVAMGFDGNVSQESHWLNHLRNYAYRRSMPFPRVEFRRYRVNDIAKNTQADFNAGGYLFPAGFARTDEGKRFVDQLWAFTGRKASRKDDAPDALICITEFLYEKGFSERPPVDTRYFSVRKRRISPLERF